MAGPPGVGKSTLAAPLWGNREVTWDHQPLPISWKPFINEVIHLLDLLRPHWSHTPAVRMTERSIYKMATVLRMPESDRSPYIQTGFVQRGLGYGWRLNQMGEDLTQLRQFFRLMPVSIGVAFLECPVDIVKRRNHDRRKNPETSFEDRSFMVPLMERPREIAIEVLKERGVPIVQIDTRQPIERAREQLVGFARNSHHAEAV